MKKLIGIFALLMAIGCQKAELIEQVGDEGGRSTEERTDTVDIEVTPEGWAGSIDTGFEF